MPPWRLDRRTFLGLAGASALGAALPAATRAPEPPSPASSRPASAGAPGPTYAGIRGFNYTPSKSYHDIGFWRDYDEALVERELDYARRLSLTSARVFLHYAVYEHDRKAFLARVRHFVRAARDRGISTMPVVWDSCFSEVEPEYGTDLKDWIPNPGVRRLGRDFWPAGEAYVRDLVQTLGPEPGLLMWDVMNEPLMTSYIWTDPPDKDARVAKVWDFVRHFCGLFASLDPAHPRTVGHAYASWIKETAGAVDVVSFHDYSPTHRRMREHLRQGLDAASALGLPVLLTETGCPARSNPYDRAVETCRDLGLGWYVWELMIGVSRWNDIHGIVYPDGTVRDPSVAAAVQGFFRRRRGDRVAYQLDKEGVLSGTLAGAAKWLDDPAAPLEDGLDLLDGMANLLEAGELVPMSEPPSVRVLGLGAAPPRSDVDRLLREWRKILAPYAAAK